MVFRTAGAVATLLLGLGGPGGQVLAQYYPPQAYPPSQGYQPPYRPLPPLQVGDDPQPYDPPVAQGRPLPPPVAIGPQADEPPQPPGQRWRRGPVYAQEPEPLPAPPLSTYREPPGPPPPGGVYRDAPPPVGYRDAPPPGYRDMPQQGYAQPPGPQQGYPQQGYAQPSVSQGQSQILQEPLPPLPGPQGIQQAAPHQSQGYEPAAAGSRPYYQGGTAPVAVQPGDDGMRPPMAIGPGQYGAQQPAYRDAPPPGYREPGQVDPNQTGTLRGDQRMAAFPAEVRPETGPTRELPLQFRRALVNYPTKEPAGTIVIDTPNTYLYLVLGNGKAMRYGVGVGREGFTWAGAEKVTKMAEWPDWNPPSEMIERQPYLPRFMAGGESNPLGARALYLGKTIYRIHGTNQPSTIGSFVSSGCIRLTNEDVMDLYTRVKVGTRVVVLPGRAPATASAAPQPGASLPPPPVSMAPPGRPSAMAR